MKKQWISMAAALMLVATNASMAHALSPVAEVYYNAGTSTYDSSEFESQLNEAIKAKLEQAGINPKYVSIMDASANAASVTDMAHVHSGYDSWYIDNGYYVTPPAVETADYNHVQITNGGRTLTFYGYTAPAYKDFMLTNGTPSGKKIITFDMDESKVDYHSMEGGGFLFNTQIDSNGKLSGYAILYVQGAVKVYKINAVDANALHNEMSYGLSYMPGVTQIGSYSKGAATSHSIKINVTDTQLNMWDNGTQIIQNLNLPDVYGNEFGPIVSHVGHGCEIISIFAFDNMKLFSTSNKTLDEAVDEIRWDTYSPLRYVVDINDDPSVLLDGGTNQAVLTNSFNNSHAQYVSVTSSVYENITQNFIGNIAQGGLNVTSEQSSSDIINEIADRVAAQIITNYKPAILAIETAESNTDIQFQSWDSKNSVSNDITLLQDEDVTTVWSSDQPSIIAPDGKVTRPVTAQSGTYVTLTATITKDGLTSEKTFTVYVNAADPAPLTTLSAAAGNGQVQLNFPPLTGASPEDIVVEQSTDGIHFSPVSPVETLNAASTSATVTGLTNGETYYFRLSVGEGFYEGESNIVTISPSQSLTSLSAVEGNGQVTLNFPALTGATNIVVEQSEDSITFTPVTLLEPLDAASTSATVAGLTNGATYYYRLTVDGGAYKGASNIVTITPSKPLSSLSAVAGNGQAKLNFPALTGATNIVVEQSEDGINFTPATVSEPINAASTSATVTGLTNGATYYYRLTVDGGAYKGESNIVTLSPSEPLTSLLAIAGNGQATLKFPALTGATNIVVEQSEDGITFTPAIVSEPINADSTSAIVTGLTNGTIYQIRLSVQSGPYAGLSNVITVQTSTPPVLTIVEQPVMNAKVIVSDPSNGGTIVKDKVTKLIGDNLNVSGTIVSANGQQLDLPNIVMNADGSFKLPKVPAGEYKLSLNVYAPNGEKLAGPAGKLTVDSNGNASITVDLVDPYGTILDDITAQPIAGVKMQLYWADTELNRSKGRVPGTLVNLPELTNFAPNKNHNPQISSDSGEYGWMVYADGDYYFLGEKDGYVVFDSRNDKREESFGTDSFIKGGVIHVGDTIVKFSYSAQPKVKATGDHNTYILGYPDGTFRPDQGIARAEVATILSRLYKPSASAAPVSYSDVSANHWAAQAITTATQNHWMVGTGHNAFEPKKQITRAEFAQMLMNMNKWDAVQKSTYTDVAGHWAEVAIATVQKQGLLSDFTEEKFNPSQPITRAEVVRIFNRLLERNPWDLHAGLKWTDVTESNEYYTDIMEASTVHPFELFETGVEIWKK